MHRLTRQGKLWLEFTSFSVIQFPPRSPDLTILDFFIFPYLKNTIFKNNPHNLEELQEAISNALSVILNKTTLSIIAFIFFKLKRLNMRTIIKLTITSHLFSQSIGILSNRIKKIPPTLIYILNDRTVWFVIFSKKLLCEVPFFFQSSFR
jgi:hypothetical protein